MQSEKRIRLRQDEVLEIYRALYWHRRENPNIVKYGEPERRRLLENLEERFKLLLEDKEPSKYRRRRKKIKA
jgi:hypothetical protein